MTKRLLVIIALAIGCAIQAAAQLTIGTHEAVKDSLNNCYMCSLPEDCFFGGSYSGAVKFEGATNLKINGTGVGEMYTFSNIRGDSRWTLTGTDSKGKAFTSSIMFTFIPIVEINCKVEKYNYNIGTVRMLLPSGNITSLCKVKYRGGSTNTSDRLKRNYHLKFIDENGDKVDFKPLPGLRNDNSWLLDAGSADRIRIRNRVLTDLWNDFATKPYYSDLEPKALNGSRGSMVEVFRNGEYQGLYNMCEPIDRKQMKLTKWDDQRGEAYGMLWKTGQRTSSTMMKVAPIYDNEKDNWNGFEVSYPDFDEYNPTDYSTLYNAVWFVANAKDKDFAEHAHEYLDVPVLIDYFIFLNVTGAYDNLGKNVYWGVYDQSTDKKITLAVWDLDTSLGQSWKVSEYHPSYLKPSTDFLISTNLDRFLSRFIKWNVNGFVTKAGERYRELRKDVLSTKSILNRFGYWIDVLSESGTKDREEKRWAKTSDLGGYTFSMTTEQQYIAEWLPARLEWLDKYYAERVNGDTNDDGVVDIADVNNVISRILGEEVVPDLYSYKLDITGDMVVDVADLNKVINIILGLDK